MTTPLVSVGIPTYNRPHYLEQAFQSLLAQTYKKLEIVVSDDCFPNEDNYKLCEKYKTLGLNIVYHRPEKNLGGPGNHYEVLQLASGKYFIWMSDDDILQPLFVQTGVELLEKNNQLDCWISSFENIDKNGKLTRTYPLMNRFSTTNNKFLDVIFFFFEPESLGKGVMIVSSIFKTDQLKVFSKHYFWKKYNHWTDNVFAWSFICYHNIYGSDQVLMKKRIIEYEKSSENNVYRMTIKDYAGYPPNISISIIKEYLLSIRTKPLLIIFVIINYPIKFLLDTTILILKKINTKLRHQKS